VLCSILYDSQIPQFKSGWFEVVVDSEENGNGHVKCCLDGWIKKGPLNEATTTSTEVNFRTLSGSGESRAVWVDASGIFIVEGRDLGATNQKGKVIGSAVVLGGRKRTDMPNHPLQVDQEGLDKEVKNNRKTTRNNKLKPTSIVEKKKKKGSWQEVEISEDSFSKFENLDLDDSYSSFKPLLKAMLQLSAFGGREADHAMGDAFLEQFMGSGKKTEFNKNV
jgi:hypothetical protein